MPIRRRRSEAARAGAADPVVTGNPTIFERLFELSPDAIALVDGEGRIRRVNGQARSMFGYSREELVGRPIETLLPERFRERHAGHRSRFQAEPRLRPMGRGLELLGRRRDGSEFPVDIMLSPVQTREGSFVLGVVRDVTERRRIEQEVRDKNVELERAMLAKDRFLAGMSHELRTPLNAIIGFAGTLLMKLPGPLNADQEKQLHTIETSGKQLLSLINNVLDLARIESGALSLRLEPVVCDEVVEETAAALRPLAEAKGIGLAVELPREPIELQSDRRTLGQILANLAHNGIKFTERGEVRIALRRRDENGARVAELSVADTGPGIGAEDRARLFQSFGELDASPIRRHGGTGLGLHVSGRLAGLIGGRISVQSEPGKGSVFTLSITES